MTEIIPYVNLGAQWQSEKDELWPIIEEIMSSGVLVGGRVIEDFEYKVAKYCNSKFCVALNSGTDALMCGLKALGVKAGDEVITPPNSFVASTAAIIHIGAIPVFVDVKGDQLIDPKKIKQAITKKTKAIMPVHLTGKMASMDEITEIAEEWSIPIIEDSAQSIGAKYNGALSGSLGAVGCFSTHPLKNLNSSGDGGFIISNDEELIIGVKEYRNHGIIDRNIVNNFGLVSRMDALQAAILSFRLDKLNFIIEKRRQNASLYLENLNKAYIGTPIESKQDYIAYHTFVIQCEKRDQLAKYLLKNGVQTSVHYPRPIHLQPAASGLGYKRGDFPMAELQSERILTLPIHQYLSAEDIGKVSSLINNFYEK